MSAQNRSLKPYPPTNPIATKLTSSVQVDWYNRNRLIVSVRKQTAATETPEVGQTTTIRVYKLDSTLIHTETGVTGTSWTYTNAAEITDAGALQPYLIFKCSAVRDGYESLGNSVTLRRVNDVIDSTDDVKDGSDSVVDF